MRTDFLPTDILLILNNYFRKARTIKTRCYICKSEFSKELRNNEKFLPEYNIIEVEKGKTEDYFHGFYRVEERDIGTEYGTFHVLQNGQELYVITSSNAHFVNNHLTRIFKWLSKEIIPVYLHADEIYELLDNFEKVKNLELIVKRVVYKRIFGLAPRTGIIFETYKEGRIYPNFKESFDFARENDMWIDRIKVSGIKSEVDQELQFSISRKTEISIDSGLFDTYFTNLLSQVMEYGKEKLEQFRGRSRREQPDKKPKPLIVKFGKKVFESLENRHDFINVLEKYPNCNYSIVHNGNPHVYLSILDRNDNSSFSVRTSGDENLIIIPQIQTSAVALMRFSEFLINFFHEGVIQNYSKKENR